MNTNQRSGDQELPPEVLAEWRQEAARLGQRPEDFWARQQMQIRARIQSHGERKPMRLWVAVATAVVVFFAVLLVVPAGPRPPKAPPQAAVDADQELLLAVEHSLATGTPEALEPLTLLVVPASNNNGSESSSNKEHGHEN
ncbi:MAG: hypothetical protein HY010_09800 [Acidobacteria bacterium]|nr:hypothetical protein [Acidobacteriota bacterium]